MGMWNWRSRVSRVFLGMGLGSSEESAIVQVNVYDRIVCLEVQGWKVLCLSVVIVVVPKLRPPTAALTAFAWKQREE